MFLAIVMPLAGCIDRIAITIPNTELPLVIDGLITDEPGPYTVQITRAVALDGNLNFRKYVTVKSVTLFDNAGNSEPMQEEEVGIYKTKANGMRGVAGREYYIRVEARDGRVYESVPDKMYPVGEVEKVYYEFETFQPVDRRTQHGFRVYADARGVPTGSNLFRWKFIGTFEIDGYPALHTRGVEGNPCAPAPRSCMNDGPFGACTCCKCWVSVADPKPRVSDNQFVTNGVFKKVEAGYVPLEYFPFQIRYRMEVKQMSLSQVAFDFWKTVQSQKEGVGSLFQPPNGKARSNIFEKGGLGEVQGLFYASAVKTKQIYLNNADVPIRQQVDRWNCEEGRIAEDCRLAYPNSTTTKPADWE